MTSPIPPFQLERYFAQWEFKAPYLLCTSDVQGYRMKDLLSLADEETAALWDNLTLGYTETTGHPLLRAEIARLYEGLSAENILCFAGAEEAIYTSMRVLLKPGDHVIVTFPGYQSLYQVAEAVGAEVSRWAVRLASGPDGKPEWKADVNELKRLIKPNTRLIVTNFPHNPTGALPSSEDWQAIVQTAREAGCRLFSDEVYRWLEFNPADRLRAAVEMDEGAISLGVMSKPFGLAGLRIGWLALADLDLRDQLASYKDYTTICNSAPGEILALIALRAKEQVLARSLNLIRQNLKEVEAFMQIHSSAFQWIAPRAGSIAFPQWLGDEPVSRFCEELVQSQGVLLLPSDVYDYSAKHVRLGLGRENLPEALKRLSQFLISKGI